MPPHRAAATHRHLHVVVDLLPRVRKRRVVEVLVRERVVAPEEPGGRARGLVVEHCREGVGGEHLARPLGRVEVGLPGGGRRARGGAGGVCEQECVNVYVCVNMLYVWKGKESRSSERGSKTSDQHLPRGSKGPALFLTVNLLVPLPAGLGQSFVH